ncbi:MAG: hypothetical protein K2X82_26190 [Gemmataceae bacterium]|nr:hypothetical protein [Gemmataceae bacterium]
MEGTLYPRPYRPDGADAAEGVELEVRASGPMPVDARKHLADLVNAARPPKKSKAGKRRPQLRLVRREDVDDIADPVVASGLAMAEADIEELDAKYAQREGELKAAPPVPDAEKAARLAKLAARIAEVIRDAEAEGVRLWGRDPDA